MGKIALFSTPTLNGLYKKEKGYRPLKTADLF